MRFRVTILQHRLLHYRVDFFQQLREMLALEDVELRLVHGQASTTEAVRKDEGELLWADKVENTYWNVRGRDLCWQPFPLELKNSDLIVLMQENRILSNYPFLLRRLLLGKPLAYWGHGANFQSLNRRGLREKWKRFLLTKVDWWFAYTDATVDIVKRAGFPEDQITCLNNAIDISEFRRQIFETADDEIAAIRSSLTFPNNAKVGLFCGSLYPEKKLELLVESADLIHQCIPEFRLIVVGDGPSGDYLRREFKSRPWAVCVGVKRGREKAAFFKMADVVLNPGLVGLHVLDAFSAGLPMISTRNALHSPEIVYLQDGRNGRLTDDNPRDYSDAVLTLLTDEDLYQRMSEAALQAADKYTLENMVKNFANGILTFLSRNVTR